MGIDKGNELKIRINKESTNKMESRKIIEKEHANRLKETSEESEAKLSNKKFYSITRVSRNYIDSWLVLKIAKGKKFLDYCCGDGTEALFLGRHGAKATGIDISNVSIDKAKEEAIKMGISENTDFMVMDGERLSFRDNSFDYIVCSGVLHHLDIDKAYSELSRVLKPDGQIICNEPLAYNPIFQIYRKFTPHLRTKWEMEHILTKGSVYTSQKYFNRIEVRMFHLFVLLAVPFRDTKIFNGLLSFLEAVDAIVLKIPGIKWLAWQIVFVISGPKKKHGQKII